MTDHQAHRSRERRRGFTASPSLHPALTALDLDGQLTDPRHDTSLSIYDQFDAASERAVPLALPPHPLLLVRGARSTAIVAV